MDIPMKLVLAGGHCKQHDAAWNSKLLHPFDRCKRKSINGASERKYKGQVLSGYDSIWECPEARTNARCQSEQAYLQYQHCALDWLSSPGCFYSLQFINLFILLNACTSHQQNQQQVQNYDK
jgi:hypothetical protein